MNSINEIWRVLKPGGFFIITVEIFCNEIKRDIRHPYSLTKKSLFSLISPSFKIIYENKSPWIGLRYYVQGSRKSVNSEIILICKPKFTLRKKLELFWRNII